MNITIENGKHHWLSKVNSGDLVRLEGDAGEEGGLSTEDVSTSPGGVSPGLASG